MDLYYDILLAATPEGCPEPPRSDFYNEMVDQLCRKGPAGYPEDCFRGTLRGVGQSAAN